MVWIEEPFEELRRGLRRRQPRDVSREEVEPILKLETFGKLTCEHDLFFIKKMFGEVFRDVHSKKLPEGLGNSDTG
jgi:hypothetical protein